VVKKRESVIDGADESFVDRRTNTSLCNANLPGLDDLVRRTAIPTKGTCLFLPLPRSKSIASKTTPNEKIVPTVQIVTNFFFIIGWRY